MFSAKGAVNEVTSFLGLVGYRRYIQSFAKIAKPLKKSGEEINKQPSRS